MLRFVLFGVILLCTTSWSTPVSSNENGRIIGGSETTIEQFPYLVSIKYVKNHRCGGVIYHFKVILVAAHCVLGLYKDEITITAGITNLRDEGEVRTVEYIIYHQEYSAWDNTYDIALITLTKAFSYTTTIQSIVLASPDEEIPAGTRGQIAGWGALFTGGVINTKLEYRDVYVVSKEECVERYKPYREISDDMICAGPWSGKGGVCYGDFGGPLVIGTRLFGIISWSIDCGSSVYPPVYVKVSAVHKWIAKVMVEIEL